MPVRTPTLSDYQRQHHHRKQLREVEEWQTQYRLQLRRQCSISCLHWAHSRQRSLTWRITPTARRMRLSASVPAPSRVATATLASITTTAGTLDAADTTFTSVSGDQSEALVLWVDTGNEATSPYLSFWDSGVTGFPLTPVGTNVVAQWSASGIITLS